MYRKMICFWLLVFSFWQLAIGQSYQGTEKIWDNLNPQVSDADSVYYSDGDTIYVAGVDTLWVFISTDMTEGVIWAHGTVTGCDGKAAEIVFEMAAHTGDGTAINSSEAESYQTMATTTATAGNSTAFSFWPMANTTLKASASNYITLRCRGTAAGELSGIKIKIEYMYQKFKRGY